MTDEPVDQLTDQTDADETDAAPEAGEAVRDLDTRLAEAEAQAAEYLDGWQRARAELDNFRKRTERERQQQQALLRGEVIAALLPVLDDFDRAIESIPPELVGQEWVSGVEIIYRKFRSQLGDLGVTEIAALGQPFDPEVHEAVMQRPDEHAEPGTVIEVVRKGYLIDDRVLRIAMVVVAG